MPRRSFRPTEVSAGGVVVRRGAHGVEVCLINDGRYWGLPKGNVEPGERAEDTALREIAEETGLDAGTLQIRASLPTSEYVYRRGGRLIFKRVHHFLVEATGPADLKPDPVEVTEAAWLSFDDALARVTFRDTVLAVREARAIVDAGVPGTPAGEP
jgi:8-oxo-dGTP pyrophosphatase MutT (NUDIX family)